MKTNKLVLVLTLSAGALSLVACGGKNEDLKDAPALSTQEVVDFTKGSSDAFEASNGWCNGNPFDVTWKKENVSYENNKMSLTLGGEAGAYTGGELRTKDSFGFGNFSVKMKPMKQVGTATTFFTYTGPSFDNDPHDEIDIEFLGKNTTKVQFNYFTDGVGGHEFMYDLGFDASESFHEYGFRWEFDKIIWYVDGTPVHKATKDIPSHPGKIFMNEWSGTFEAEAWMGKFTGPEDGKAGEYLKVGYEDLQGKGYTYTAPVDGSDDKDDNDDNQGGGAVVDDAFTSMDLTFTANDDNDYTVTKGETSTNVVYTNVTNSYHNIVAKLPESATGKNVYQMSIKNNGTEKVEARIDLMDDASKVFNTSATQDGKTVKTDLTWGGSYFTIQPGETSVCQVVYEGNATQVVLLLDSCTYGQNGPFAGNVDLSDFKIGSKEVTDTPDNPDSGETTDVAEKTNMTMTFNAGEEYTLSPVDGGTRVSYTNVTNNYHNVNGTFAEDLTGYKNIALTVTNNAETKAEVRIDVMTGGTVAGNTSAKIGTTALRTDLEWGGSYFTIGAGKTYVVKIAYTGTAESINIFLDSATYGENGPFAGDVTVKNFTAIKDSSVAIDGDTVEYETVTDTGNVDNPDTPVEETKDTIALTPTYNQGDAYICTATDDGEEVTYTDMTQSWKVVNVTYAEDISDCDAISFKVKNNGTETVQGRVDIMNASEKAINTSATCDGVAIRTDLEWGGSFYQIAPGATVEVKVTYAGSPTSINFFFDSFLGDDLAHSGDVTISGLTAHKKVAEETKAATPLTLTYNPNEGYTCAATDEGEQVTYTDMTQSWKVVNAVATEDLSTFTVLSFKVKNNGTETVHGRVDLVDETKTGNCKAVNVSATCDGSSIRTDLEWGGSFYDIPAGATVEVKVTYKGNPSSINFFFDSFLDAGVMYSGDVLISDVKAL